MIQTIPLKGSESGSTHKKMLIAFDNKNSVYETIKEQMSELY